MRSPVRRAQDLLSALLPFRRLAAGGHRCPAVDRACCVAVQLPLVARQVAAGRPLEMAVPAFPAKNPSPRKVLGVTPDMAEEQALRYLQGICDRLSELYAPGARVKICSDGRVFSDVVGIGDEDVTRYGDELRALIGRLQLSSLDVFSLDDVFGGVSYALKRERVCRRYAEPVEAIRAGVRRHSDHRRLFNGIHRFLVEDLRGVHPEMSRSRLHRICMDRAYLVIQRSRAWSRVVAERFPDALRLSIHPQPAHGAKIGIRLADAAADSWITPWHGVAVYVGGTYRLAYRYQAEAAGARLVCRDGKPSHYIQP